MFTEQRAYERERKLNTEDLLTAVKHSMNYESDLYYNGRLLVSWLGLPMEDNIQNLEQVGITTYIQNNRYQFKYADETKNITKYYVWFFDYEWEGVPKLQINVHDYKEYKECIEFDSKEDLYNYVREHYRMYESQNINIIEFLDAECKSYPFDTITA